MPTTRVRRREVAWRRGVCLELLATSTTTARHHFEAGTSAGRRRLRPGPRPPATFVLGTCGSMLPTAWYEGLEGAQEPVCSRWIRHVLADCLLVDSVASEYVEPSSNARRRVLGNALFRRRRFLFLRAAHHPATVRQVDDRRLVRRSSVVRLPVFVGVGDCLFLVAIGLRLVRRSSIVRRRQLRRDRLAPGTGSACGRSLDRSTVDSPVHIPHHPGPGRPPRICRRRRSFGRPVQRTVRRSYADQSDLGQPVVVDRSVRPQRNFPPLRPAGRRRKQWRHRAANRKRLFKVRAEVLFYSVNILVFFYVKQATVSRPLTCHATVLLVRLPGMTCRLICATWTYL